MKTVQYKAWRDEFDKLVKAYLLGISWENFNLDNGDIGAVGDELQIEAYRNIYFSINAETDAGYDHNPDIFDWANYEESCSNRTDFEIDLKLDKDKQLEIRQQQPKVSKLKTVQYKAWREEFDKLAKAYLLGVEWEKVLFNSDDFGAVGDELQSEAYRNIYFSINAETDAGYDHNPDISDWVNYDPSTHDLIDFEMNFKNEWDVVVETRNNESKESGGLK